MSYFQEKVDVESFFIAQWAATTPIVFENGESSNNANWVRLSIQNGEAYQASLGDDPAFRHPGIVFVQIFTPKDEGSGPALQFADLVDAIFRNQKLGNIRFRVPQVRKVPIDSEWYTVNVSVEFYRED